MVESAGTFTSGMMTYLNKLGPGVLGEGYAGPIDRQWAASLTPVTFRWRMRDVVRLLADGLAPGLSARPGAPLTLLNIGGGPAMDSLNALIVLQKEHPDWMAGRKISVLVLDLDSEGPAFGARALAALQAEGGPLHGLVVAFQAVCYDWSKPADLGRILADCAANGSVMMGSTEGGLFEYGSDEDIVANLAVLRTGTPADFGMVGPVVRDPHSCDPRLSQMDQVEGCPAIRFIGWAAFQQLAARAGWSIARTLDGPMHQVVQLTKS
jgi:hypothetical protein